MFDLSRIESSEYTTIPNGFYPAFIESVQMKTSSAGAEYLSAQFKIFGDSHEGRVVFGTYNINHEKEQVRNIALADIKAMLSASGFSEEQMVFKNVEELLSAVKSVRCQIKVATRKQEGYDDQNVIKGYKKLEESKTNTMPASDVPF